MADFPDISPWDLTSGAVISTVQTVTGIWATLPVSTAWVANLAVFVPVRVPRQVTVYKLVAGCGTGTGGNCDLGIYDVSGNRLVSAGATARPGASQEVIADVTDTTIGPGIYYLALVGDDTSTFMCFGMTLEPGRLTGAVQMASAYVLPATATYAALSNELVPSIAAYLRSE